MAYDLQTYRDVFSAFTTYDGGLRVGDVIQPNKLMVQLGWMPDVTHEILDSMVEEGFLTQRSMETKPSMNSLGNVWYLTSKGFEMYLQICC